MTTRVSSNMLDGLFREQHFTLAHITGKTGLERGANNVVEEESPVYKECEANHLQPLE